MKFKDIKKYVINLKRRDDRLRQFEKEMQFMGWDFNVFEAIDTNSYEGCGFSHMAVAKLLLESNEEYIIVFEDDIFFMPYAKQLIEKVENKLNNMEWDIFNFAPSIHRPLNKYCDVLVDLVNLPPKDPNRHRGIFGLSGVVYNRKVAEIVTKWNTNEIIENSHMHNAVDQYFDSVIYPRFKSFCPIYPLVTQYTGFSNINKTVDHNHYLMTYNWESYIAPLPKNLLDHENCVRLRNNNELGLTL